MPRGRRPTARQRESFQYCAATAVRATLAEKARLCDENPIDLHGSPAHEQRQPVRRALKASFETGICLHALPAGSATVVAFQGVPVDSGATSAWPMSAGS